MTPANVANETPATIDNLMQATIPEVGPKETLRPLETSADYIPIPRATMKVIVKSDPIVGGWKYVGTGYVCNAQFVPDNTGYVGCYQGFISFLKRSFTWTPNLNSPGLMRTYLLKDTDNRNYTIMYSPKTGGLTGDFIPDGGYFVKVD